jgi:nucleotide-binding universal stress UspA family protein
MGSAIVVGTDGSESATKAVMEAVRLAAALGEELHIVSAYRPLKVNTGSLPAELSGVITSTSKVDAVLDEAAGRARMAKVTAHIHGVPGDPTDAILEVAEQEGASVIVIGNRGLNGVKRVLLGSVPSKIVHQAPCSTYIVHTT